MKRVVLYGVGSPLTVEFEETCRRLGIEIAAAIHNVEGPSWATAGTPLLAAHDTTESLKGLGIALPMFTPANRRKALEDARRRGFARVETLVDPTAILAASTRVGEGVYINAGCVIGAAAKFGDFVLVNRSASIGHHAELGDFVSLGPAAVLAGNVRIGAGACVGAGAIILPEVEIGAGAVVAAGAVVTKTVPPNCRVMGSPARVVGAMKD